MKQTDLQSQLEWVYYSAGIALHFHSLISKGNLLIEFSLVESGQLLLVPKYYDCENFSVASCDSLARRR